MLRRRLQTAQGCQQVRGTVHPGNVARRRLGADEVHVQAPAAGGTLLGRFSAS